MNTTFKTAITVLLTSAILAVCAIACSDDPPPLDGETPAATDSDTQTEVDILQNDHRFITIVLSPYRSSLSDIDPSVFHPWCTPPDAEWPVIPPKVRKSPPVPEYLPEGTSFDKAVHEDGRHVADIYTSDFGNGNRIRLTVTYGLFSPCLITSRAPELLEQVSVAGSWGVIARNMKDLFETLTLYIESELGYVEIQRIDTENKGRVGKDELIKIAESMPIFGEKATSTDVQTEVDILQSDRKFITIALSRYRSDISSIDPSVLHPWCTHPDAESVTVPPKQRKSPPVPEYLPEGVSLHREVHLPNGRHFQDTYVSDGGNGNHIRLNVTHGTCLITSKAPEFIEQTSVAGNWGVFLSGAKGAGSFDLHFETDLGVVSINRVITGGKEQSVTKDELIKIAESMPIFGGEAASDSTLTPPPVSTSTPDDEKKVLDLNSFAEKFRELEGTRQTINDDFLTIGEELDASEFSQIVSVLDRVIHQQTELIREVEAIDPRSEVTSRLKDDLEYAYSEQLEGYTTLLAMTKRAYEDQPAGKPRELKEKYPGMYAHAWRRLSNGDGYVKRVSVELNKQFFADHSKPPTRVVKSLRIPYSMCC
ncbi:MAG: hypothetical protein OXD46_12595 [Chloroflexi bacterium]|nr:hypothetical protein [Chloroflexota bacterium]